MRQYVKKDGKTFVNQKTLKINNPAMSYAELKEIRHTAMKTLSYASFIIWTELQQNIDGFEWRLSKAYFRDECGISEKSYERAIKELTECGYIVMANETFGFFNVCGKTAKPTAKADTIKENATATEEEQPKACLSNSDVRNEDTPRVSSATKVADFKTLLKSTATKRIQGSSGWRTYAFKDFAEKVWNYYSESISGSDASKEPRIKKQIVASWEAGKIIPISDFVF